MWFARRNADTRQDVPAATPSDVRLRRLWLRLAAVVAATGYLIGQGGLGEVAASGR
ncbi:hypothetical protein O7602_27855 [Micromonospora sp. WMMD1128]|uniref:hypothetical protein n=1 Tax=Micromonospora sp. WMMD1128 TaxID=3015150 RepID=UPI00248B31C9|nr:hypothetical protein [Micromonospora sp. WMMD1128]WBB73447.1 hypothetical protein O7602_27855 [Micromonospora sp. WMMD1128]